MKDITYGRCNFQISTKTYFISSRITESYRDVSAGAVASLIVMVIDEDDGAVSVEHVPGLVQVQEPFELVDASEILAQEFAIPEFRHATHVGVIGSFDRLTT